MSRLENQHLLGGGEGEDVIGAATDSLGGFLVQALQVTYGAEEKRSSSVLK